MSTTRTCPKCGASFSGGALEGLCPNCVGRLAFVLEPEAVRAGEPRSLLTSGALLHYFGDYELLGEIARGGMGVVYKARQISLNRTVAVKMILSGQLASAEDVSRFRAEAEAAANLQHPNIVAIHEVGEQDGHHYFSMDYVAGKSLAEVIHDLRFTKEDFRRIAGWVKTIAEAIHFAHEQGTLHRDLKPSNVLIDSFDQPHLTDFGLAKRIRQDPDLTASGQVLGTPNFMSPEQAAGKRGAAGPWSDVYSLGAILYFLLTGKPPHGGETVPETLANVLDAEPAAPRESNRDVPRDLETICLKCLEKETRRRYASARELALDLGRFLNDGPILARPVSRLEYTWRRILRHPAASALAVTLLITATGLLALFTRLRQDRESISFNGEMWAVDATTFTKRGIGPVAGAAVDPKTGNYWTAVLDHTPLDPAGVLIRDGATDMAIDVLKLGGTNGYCPGSIDFDAKHRVAWVAAQCGNGNDPIWLVDADDHTVKKGPIGCGGVNGEPTVVNPVTGRYYHLVSGEVPQRVDPNTFAVTRTAFGPVLGVNAAANILYAVGPRGSLQIINGAPDPEVVLTNVSLPFACTLNSIGVDPVHNRIYIPNPVSNEIVILEGSTGQDLGRVLLDNKLANLRGVRNVVFDDVSNRLYAIVLDKDDRYSWPYAVQDGHQQALRITWPNGGPVLNTRFNKIYVWAGPP